MADKEPKEASKPTWEQIVEAANDPAMVQALAGKHGMKVVNESEEALVKEDLLRRKSLLLLNRQGNKKSTPL